MTNCLHCGLSLQGRDNESDTCSDCLLDLTDKSYSTIEGVIRQTINQPIMTTYNREIKKELLLDPIEMTEELMAHIFNAEFGGELNSDHRFFELYLQLQLFKEKMLKDEEDSVIAIEGDEVRS